MSNVRTRTQEVLATHFGPLPDATDTWSWTEDGRRLRLDEDIKRQAALFAEVKDRLDVARLKTWREALASGEYSPVGGTLWTEFEADEVGYCCLGVLCEVDKTMVRDVSGYYVSTDDGNNFYGYPNSARSVMKPGYDEKEVTIDNEVIGGGTASAWTQPTNEWLRMFAGLNDAYCSQKGTQRSTVCPGEGTRSEGPDFAPIIDLLDVYIAELEN